MSDKSEVLIADLSQVQFQACGDAERRYLAHEVWSEGKYLLTLMLNDDGETIEISFGGVEYEIAMPFEFLQELVTEISARTEEERKQQEDFPHADLKETYPDDYQVIANTRPKLEYLSSADEATVRDAKGAGNSIDCLIEYKGIPLADVTETKGTAERLVILKRTPAAIEMPIQVLNHLMGLALARIQEFSDGGWRDGDLNGWQ